MQDEDVRFAVLGPLRAWRGDAELDLGQPQQRAVLAALLIREGGHATLDGLVGDVWGEAAPATSARLVRTYIYRLRRVLGRSGSGHIRSVGGGYVLENGPQVCDMTRFTLLVAQGRRARTDGDLVEAVGHYAEGLALWRGTALAGVPGPCACAQRARLNELRLNAQEERLACTVELGLYDHATAELAALIAEHPLHEQLRELQMHALYGAGRQAQALGVFRETELLLREELGVGPGPGLHSMHQRILGRDPALLRLGPEPARPRPTLTPPTAPPAVSGGTAPGHPAPPKATGPKPVPAQLPPDVVHHLATLDEARQDLPLYHASGDHRGQADVPNGIGCIHARLGSHRQALTACQEALELHRGLDRQDFEAAILDSLGHAHHHLGHHQQAIDCYHRALALFRNVRHTYHQAEADTLTRLGEIHQAAGDLDAAREAWEQARVLFENLPFPDEQVRLKLKELRNTTARTTMPLHTS